MLDIGNAVLGDITVQSQVGLHSVQVIGQTDSIPSLLKFPANIPSVTRVRALSCKSLHNQRSNDDKGIISVI